MSNANAKISRPSQAYSQATGSLVYRLSELTFGSLLAAYSLGFVGAIAAHWNDLSFHGSWGILLLSVQYASISITFAYLTTSFYLTYHAGILTMPQMPLYDLRVDFTLAIVQAVIFGFSLLRPWSFSILLALNFYVTGYRQRREYDELAKFYTIGFVTSNGALISTSLVRAYKNICARTFLNSQVGDPYLE